MPFPPNKGEKIRTFNQLEFLRKRGFDITVFCLLHEPADAGHAADLESTTGIRVVTANVGFGKLRMLAGLYKLRALSVSNFYCIALQNKLDQYFAKTEVDTVYVTSSAMAEYVFRGRWNSDPSTKSPRQVIDFMDLDSDKWRQYVEINKFPMSWVYRYESKRLFEYEKRIQGRFEQCIFISSNEVDLFQQKLPQKADNLNIVGNGVDLDVFRPRADLHADRADPSSTDEGGSVKLLFSGVMDYLPNENAMLWFVENVWEPLRQIRPDAELVIAGMNPSQAIQDLALTDGITVTGFVDDMLACYHQANLFIAPFQIARGVQNKVLQAFACGLPVVSTAVGAEGIECTVGVHYAQASTPDQFVEQIIRLSDDHNHYRKIAENAIDLVNQKYTWEAMNADLFQLFLPSTSNAA